MTALAPHEDRAFFGHPRGLGLLFAVEMWERFSYYGMRALLVLYLVNALGWTTADATGLYGTYTSLVFLTPLLGGWLADRWLGTRRAMILGGVIISAGHFTMAAPGMVPFYTGLALIVAGTGLFKPNVSTQVGELYAPGDPRRDGGFTIFYMGINLGAALGPLACGWLAQGSGLGWHWGFAAAGVGMALGLGAYLWGRERLLHGVGLRAPRPAVEAADGPPAERSGLHALLGGGGGLAVAAALGVRSPQPLLLAAAAGAAFGVTVLGSRGAERRRVLAIFLVAFFVVLFWAAYEQAGSSLNLFADRNTDLRVGRFEIPSSWFQSVPAAAILIFGLPFTAAWAALARRGREPSTPAKMAAGLALLGLGFLVMVAAGARADAGAKVSPLWLVAGYTLHTLGELCLSPVGLSYVTKVAPARFASLLMGAWFLANAVANKIAGALAAFTPEPGQAPPAAAAGLGGVVQRAAGTFEGFFSIFVVTSLAAAALLALAVPLVKRLTAGVKA